MHEVDERLRRVLHEAGVPADPAGAFERISRRHTRRRHVIRAQRAMLVGGVLAGVTIGVLGLTEVFRGSGEPIPANPGPSAPMSRNGDIAYVVSERDGDEIWTIPADGGPAQRLADEGGYVEGMDWTSDGRRLAFGLWDAHTEDVPSGGYAVLGVRPDGSDLRVLVPSSVRAGLPSWSPDGRQLALVQSMPGDDYRLIVYDLERDDVLSVLARGKNVRGPDWSPDGSRILFQVSESGGQLAPGLYTVPPTGGNPTLVSQPGYGGTWSPDGSQIVFRQETMGDPDAPTLEEAIAALPPELAAEAKAGNLTLEEYPEELFVMNADGTNVHRLTANAMIKQGPVWSPDGTRIAFDCEGTYICSIAADGSDLRLEQERLAHSPVAWQPLPEDPSPADGAPSPSSDPGIAAAGRILYALQTDPPPSDPDGRGYYTNIWAAAADGTDARRLFGPIELDPPTATFSPDGTRIAFLRFTRPSLDDEIWIMNADGTDARRQALPATAELDGTPGGAGATSLAWSPDGSRLAYLGPLGGRGAGLWVMSIDGSHQRMLSPEPYGLGGSLTWSPDGREILATGLADPDTVARRPLEAIIAFAADGSGQRNLLEGEDIAGGSARWSPDGTQIVFARGPDGYATDIYVMDSDGSDVHRLTMWDGYDGDPFWSPDGTRILFRSDRDASPELLARSREEHYLRYGGVGGAAWYSVVADGSGVRRTALDPGAQVSDWG